MLLFEQLVILDVMCNALQIGLKLLQVEVIAT